MSEVPEDYNELRTWASNHDSSEVKGNMSKDELQEKYRELELENDITEEDHDSSTAEGNLEGAGAADTSSDQSSSQEELDIVKKPDKKANGSMLDHDMDAESGEEVVDAQGNQGGNGEDHGEENGESDSGNGKTGKKQGLTKVVSPWRQPFSSTLL